MENDIRDSFTRLYRLMRRYNEQNCFYYIDTASVKVMEKRTGIAIFSINFPKAIEDLTTLSEGEFNAYMYLNIKQGKKSIIYKIKKLLYKLKYKGE